MNRMVTAELAGRRLDDILVGTGKVISLHFPLPEYRSAGELLRMLGGARTSAILAIPPVHIRWEEEVLGSYMISAVREESITFSIDSEHEAMRRLYDDVAFYYTAAGMRTSKTPPDE